MITRYWHLLKSGALALLAAWGIWTAWRALDRGARARNAGALLGNVNTAYAAHARADELHARAERKKATAEHRIEQIRAHGHDTMAQRLERMNAL